MAYLIILLLRGGYFTLEMGGRIHRILEVIMIILKVGTIKEIAISIIARLILIMMIEAEVSVTTMKVTTSNKKNSITGSSRKEDEE